MSTDDLSPQDRMFQVLVGFWASQAVAAAARLGLADHLHDRPRTADELAAATGTHAPSLARLLRALAGAGVFREDRGRFALTPLGETLRTGVPGSLRGMIMAVLGGEHYRAWGGLLHSVETGRTAFDHIHGMPVFDYYARHPEEAAIFNDAMTSGSAVVESAVLEAFDFSPYRKVVDVGGGHGRFLSSILKAHPRAEGVLFDAPQVVEGAVGRLEAEGLAGRCRVVGGDFFEAVPEGGDLYVMKWIVHDWDDRRSLEILKNCHRAMAEGGALLLVESVLPEGGGASFGHFADLNMMVMTGGKERTEAEFRALLGATGFALTGIRPTRSPVSLVMAEWASIGVAAA
jgi:SAM-dependent methyltransferase